MESNLGLAFPLANRSLSPCRPVPPQS
jgi:hypothetical protein